MNQPNEFDIKPLLDDYLHTVNKEIRDINRLAFMGTIVLTSIAMIAVTSVL